MQAAVQAIGSTSDAPMGAVVKTCLDCGVDKPVEQFYQHRGRPVSPCKPCHGLKSSEWSKRNPDKARARSRRSLAKNKEKYYRANTAKRAGVSVSELERLEAEHQGLCAICKMPEAETIKRTGRLKKLAVDHDHATGKVRGLLCRRCNNFIVAMIEKLGPEKVRGILDEAITYLKKHGSIPS